LAGLRELSKKKGGHQTKTEGIMPEKPPKGEKITSWTTSGGYGHVRGPKQGDSNGKNEKKKGQDFDGKPGEIPKGKMRESRPCRAKKKEQEKKELARRRKG